MYLEWLTGRDTVKRDKTRKRKNSAVALEDREESWVLAHRD